MATIRSFDRTEEIEAELVQPDRFRDLFDHLHKSDSIARGAGLNYCLAGAVANGQTVLSNRFNRFLAFDPKRGTVVVEPGVTMGDLFEFATARSLLPPVLPGHPQITVGGAVAMNIHGKNQHRVGNFGDHVRSLTLYHPDYKEISCSPSETSNVFWLTVGGFGLTGFVLSVEIELMPLAGTTLTVERRKVGNLTEAAQMLNDLGNSADYLYSWHDLNRRGSDFGCGVIYIERFSPVGSSAAIRRIPSTPFKPFPVIVLNNMTLPIMCRLYRLKETLSTRKKTEDLFTASFPIVGKEIYFRLFGQRGFREYQLLVAAGAWPAFLEDLTRVIRGCRIPIALASLKLMRGTVRYLNFNGNGISLALDVLNVPSSVDLFAKLDEITLKAGGIANIAKDSRLSADVVRRMYSGYQTFRNELRAYDPSLRFQSQLRRRLSL